MQLQTNQASEIIRFIKKELTGKYPAHEISSFIFWLFEAYLGWSKTQVLINENNPVAESSILKFLDAAKRLKKYEPIQYILGYTEFYGLRLAVNPSVLIPRPETEELVHLILQNETYKNLSIIDLCTGSGCIALSLKKEFPDAQIMGLDIDKKAIETASGNALQLALEVEFICEDIFSFKSPQKMDVIVSNPPYVCESEKQQMQPNVLDYEPAKALFVPDNNPLLFYKTIAGFASENLTENGTVYLEINEAFGNECSTLFMGNGFNSIDLYQDINGKNRMLKIKR